MNLSLPDNFNTMKFPSPITILLISRILNDTGILSLGLA